MLCNDAHLTPPAGPGEPWSGLGDPTELALLSAAGKAGLTREDLEGVYTRIGEVPFDSATQRMTTAHLVTRSGERRVLVVTKGSVEALHAQHGSGRQAADVALGPAPCHRAGG